MAANPNPSKAIEAQVEMRDFAGLASYPDPHDVQPGAARLQTNVTSIRPGELTVRQGFKRVRFDS
jgi:hypothetical protein